jgi:hypothetical protein
MILPGVHWIAMLLLCSKRRAVKIKDFELVLAPMPFPEQYYPEWHIPRLVSYCAFFYFDKTNDAA